MITEPCRQKPDEPEGRREFDGGGWIQMFRRNEVSDEEAKMMVASWIGTCGVYYDPASIAKKLKLPVRQVSRVLGAMFLEGEVKRVRRSR